MRIGSKIEFYRLTKAGCLGNTLRLFNGIEEALDSGVQTFGLREVGIAGGGLHFICCRANLARVIVAHASRRLVIDEAAPDTDVTLQGEVCRTFRGWEGLLGIRTGRRMRDSIRLGLLRPYRGLAVVALLRQFLDPSSVDDVENLLDLYPEATIELAAYPYNLGKIPGRNTLIWEVRDY